MTDTPAPMTPGSGPASTSRRRMLMGLGLAGGGAVLGRLAPGSASAGPASGCPFSGAQAVPGEGPSAGRQPFHGVHQAGIVTPRPAAGLVVAFDVLATTRPELERLLRGLTDHIERLTAGGPAEALDPRFPPPDSGLLGPEPAPANLTMTVALGASLFDGRFGLKAHKPAQLVAMPHFPNDALDADECHGDLAVQICSDSTEANIHALRDLIKSFPDLISPRWKQEGFVPSKADGTNPPGDNPPLAKRSLERSPSSRNLLGFRDGTANPEPTDTALMDRLVWVQPSSPAEPAWTAGGTYQVVRIVRTMVERWDRTPLGEQEAIIGRHKPTGAPLTRTSEFEDPRYDDDPAGARTPLDAHIRLANPRVAGTERNVILRRPFNYSRGLTKAGQLDMGLLFICFQADLEAGFTAVQTRLNGEPLEEYIKPVGGGYFFALPGVPAKGGYLGQPLMEAAAAGPVRLSQDG